MKKFESMMKRNLAWKKGWAARHLGKPITDNEYKWAVGPVAQAGRSLWDTGWQAADREVANQSQSRNSEG